VNKDERIGEAGPVKSAIHLGRNDGFSIAVGEVDDFERHPHVKNLTYAPRIDFA
jgi:hypothetical protein